MGALHSADGGDSADGGGSAVSGQHRRARQPKQTCPQPREAAKEGRWRRPGFRLLDGITTGSLYREENSTFPLSRAIEARASGSVSSLASWLSLSVGLQHASVT